MTILQQTRAHLSVFKPIAFLLCIILCCLEFPVNANGQTEATDEGFDHGGQNISVTRESEDAATGAPLVLTINSGVQIPVETEYDLMNPGVGADVQAFVRLPMVPWLGIGTGITYTFIPVRAETSMSFVSAIGGASFIAELRPRFYLYGTAGIGGYYGFFNAAADNPSFSSYQDRHGGGFMASVEAGLSIFLLPTLSVGAHGGYHFFGGMTHSFRGGIGATIHFDGLTRRVEPGGIRVDPLFPALRSTYVQGNAGSVVLTNNERFEIEEIEVTATIPGYVDEPRRCIAPAGLEPGESAPVSLSLYLEKTALNLTEPVVEEVVLEVAYTLAGKRHVRRATAPVRIMNRNAMSWDDDRKAAAFVSAKDPVVLELSKSVSGTVAEIGPDAVDANLRTAMGMFSALQALNLSYVIDPNTPSYIEASGNTGMIDFLQFPRETMQFLGGDCDDLSILYCALLESVGVPTAFVTVPEHIFVAVALDMDFSEAERTFASMDDLIVYDEMVWIPVEVTAVDETFTRAWELGARRWIETTGSGAATGFYPIRECWEEYEAVGHPPEKPTIRYPSMMEVADGYAQDLAEFTRRELAPKVAELERRISTSSRPALILNRLGVLYARYGLYEQAETEFVRALDTQPGYFPAVMNLGNLYFLMEEHAKALDAYAAAEEAEPGNPNVQIALARTYHAVEEYDQADRHFSLATRSDPELADRYPYLASGAASGGSGDSAGAVRAAEADPTRGGVLWEEE